MDTQLIENATLALKSASVGRPAAAVQSVVSGNVSGAAHGGKTPEAIKKAATDFEAMFLTQMLQPMFEGIKTTGLFGEGEAGGIYRSMMLDQYGKSIAKAGGLGIADAVAREMIRMQEAQRQ